MRSLVLAVVALLVGVVSFPATAEVLRGTGGWVGFSSRTLTREWVIVNDGTLPARLVDMKIETRVDDRRWVYDISYNIDVTEAITAIEVRSIPFSIWGETDRTLSATEIKDMAPGPHGLSGTWRILSENDAVEHYAMLGYVAQVKLATGAVLKADVSAVVKAAQEFSEDFTSDDLAKKA
ncbi:MAG: hypothetical protein GDA40_07425 [Rhodobacteraceae bacterium]|nr:hypothetical protein [Paracoccaceae bacterium]